MQDEFERTRDELVAVVDGADVTEAVTEVLTRAGLPLESEQLVREGWYLVAVPEMSFKIGPRAAPLRREIRGRYFVLVTRVAERARQIADMHPRDAVVLGELPQGGVTLDTEKIELLTLLHFVLAKTAHVQFGPVRRELAARYQRLIATPEIAEMLGRVARRLSAELFDDALILPCELPRTASHLKRDPAGLPKGWWWSSPRMVECGDGVVWRDAGKTYGAGACSDGNWPKEIEQALFEREREFRRVAKAIEFRRYVATPEALGRAAQNVVFDAQVEHDVATWRSTLLRLARATTYRAAQNVVFDAQVEHDVAKYAAASCTCHDLPCGAQHHDGCPSARFKYQLDEVQARHVATNDRFDRLKRSMAEIYGYVWRQFGVPSWLLGLGGSGEHLGGHPLRHEAQARKLSGGATHTSTLADVAQRHACSLERGTVVQHRSTKAIGVVLGTKDDQHAHVNWNSLHAVAIVPIAMLQQQPKIALGDVVRRRRGSVELGAVEAVYTSKLHGFKLAIRWRKKGNTTSTPIARVQLASEPRTDCTCTEDDREVVGLPRPGCPRHDPPVCSSCDREGVRPGQQCPACLATSQR